MAEQQRVVPLDRLGMSDLAQVGGKNASLGEMIRHLAAEGVRVPGGFATTAFAFHEFIDASQLRPRIDAALAKLDVDDVKALSRAGAEIRGWIAEAPLPRPLEREIADAYGQLLAQSPNAPVAVRSSATAEDLPDASFAGQQETFLNVNGLENVPSTPNPDSIRWCSSPPPTAWARPSFRGR
jgi:pyruvate,water dikinase